MSRGCSIKRGVAIWCRIAGYQIHSHNQIHSERHSISNGRYCVTNMRTLQGTELSGTEKETLWCPIPKYQLWVQVDHETPFLMFTSSLVVDQ